jgi:hypothetical protein
LAYKIHNRVKTLNQNIGRNAPIPSRYTIEIAPIETAILAAANDL